MHVLVTVTIYPGEAIPRRTPARLATEVMQAFDADPEKDTVTVTLNAAATIGGPASLPAPAPDAGLPEPE